MLASSGGGWSERCKIEYFSKDDLNSFSLLDRDEQVVKYLGRGIVQSESQSRAKLNKILLDYKNYQTGLFAIYSLDYRRCTRV